MSKQANPTVIGGFVLGALGLLIAGLLALGSGTLLRERVALVTDFPGSVQGLNIGAQVQFQGVTIGQVTGIDLDYLPEQNRFRIPVRYEIWPRSVNVLGSGYAGDAEAALRRLVAEQGLRARLQAVSLVTGQYLVALNLNPGLPAPSEPLLRGSAIVVPAVEATRDRIDDLLTNLNLNELVAQAGATLEAIYRIAESGLVTAALGNLDLALIEGQQLLARLNSDIEPLAERAGTLLDEYAALAVGARAQLDALAPELAEAVQALAHLADHLDQRSASLATDGIALLTQGRQTLRAFERLASEDSPTQHRLNRMLEEITRAARATRELTEFLQRHPEALLQGKQ